MRSSQTRLVPPAVGVVLVAFGAVVPISGDFRSLVVLSFLALLFVSSGWRLTSRLTRMLLSLGLALPDRFFCSGLLRLRGLALLTLGDFRSVVELSFLALLFVSSRWRLTNRLTRMLLSPGLALPARFFCSGLLRLRGLALLTLCCRRTALITCGFSARCLLT